jgi:glycosyltransferase involved in cell wall biosynthesis
MHVVWMSSHHPAPREGGAAVHEFELIRAVAERHRVHVICAGIERRSFPELAEIGVTVTQVIWEPDPPRSRLDAYWRLIAKDAGVAYWRQGQKLALLRDALQRYQSEHDVDLTHLVMGDIAPVIEVSRAPTALLLFDVFSRHAEREVLAARTMRDRFAKLALRRLLRRWETTWYPRATSVACVAAPDAAAVATMLPMPVEVIPNPVSDAFFVDPVGSRSGDTVSFIATLDYQPNIEGLRWLVDAVWPGVVARRPDAKLCVVGWKPDDDVIALAQRVGAEVHPNVDDVRPYYWRSAVSVAPMHLGSGLRNKILHAMACRTPVVSTSAAAEGLPVVDGRDILVRDDPGGFAAAIVETLNDPAAARRRAETAVVQAEPFASANVGEQLERWWQRTQMQAQHGVSDMGADPSRPIPER